MVVVTMLM